MNKEYGFMDRKDATEWVTAHEEDDRFMMQEPISCEMVRISEVQLKMMIMGGKALVLVTAGNANVWVVRLIPRGTLRQLIGYRCDIPFFILAKEGAYALHLNQLCDRLLRFSGRWLTRGGLPEEDSVVELLNHPEIYYKKIEDAYALANAEIDRLVNPCVEYLRPGVGYYVGLVSACTPA
jgi:hypothetical protein